MRIHYLQHVPFEGPAYVLEWADARGTGAGRTLLYRNDPLPSQEDFDLLLVMGGPMNIYEERRYPWLGAEKAFIRESIDAGKRLLGICLGAQLIADALGGSVVKGVHKEIGWFEVSLPGGGPGETRLFRGFPEKFMAFHWHGDVIHLPETVRLIALSGACPVQAFEFDGRVAGTQFHLESTSDSIGQLLRNCSSELTAGDFIQKPEAIRQGAGHLPAMHGLMDTLLANFANGAPSPPEDAAE